MNGTNSRPKRRVAFLAALLIPIGSCNGGDSLLSPRPERSAVGATLVACPSNESESVGGLIDAGGGTLSVAGHSITLPLGAVSRPTYITLTAPASPYVELEIRADGQERFLFENAVLITIDYSRCMRPDLADASLEAWYIDARTHALLENMGGVDDKASRRLTFSTGHLSNYAIAD